MIINENQRMRDMSRMLEEQNCNEDEIDISCFGVFIPAPMALFCDSNLSDAEFRVLLIILFSFFNKKPSFQSQGYLAKKTNKSRVRINAIIKSLQEKGYIKCKKYTGHTNTMIPQHPESIYPFLKEGEYLAAEGKMDKKINSISYFMSKKNAYLKEISENNCGTNGEIKEEKNEKTSEKPTSAHTCAESYAVNNENQEACAHEKNNEEITQNSTTLSENFVPDVKQKTSSTFENFTLIRRSTCKKNSLRKKNKCNSIELHDLHIRDFNSSKIRESEVNSKERNNRPDAERAANETQGNEMRDEVKEVLIDAAAKSAAAIAKRSEKRKQKQDFFTASSPRKTKNNLKGSALENVPDDMLPENCYGLYEIYRRGMKRNHEIYFEKFLRDRSSTPKDLRRLKDMIDVHGFQNVREGLNFACERWSEITSRIFALQNKPRPLLNYLITDKYIDEIFSIMSDMEIQRQKSKEKDLKRKGPRKGVIAHDFWD